MPAENLRSPSITNLDTVPPIANTTGQGAPGHLRQLNDHQAMTANATFPSTYRIVRIPTNACVKNVFITNPAIAGGAADIDIAFSDSPNESGPYQSFGGGVVQITGPVDNKLFGAAVSLATANTTKEVTFAGIFTTAHKNLPLWQVLTSLGATQFVTDPGGFFDIVLKTTATQTAGGDVEIDVRYVCDG